MEKTVYVKVRIEKLKIDGRLQIGLHPGPNCESNYC